MESFLYQNVSYLKKYMADQGQDDVAGLPQRLPVVSL